MDIWYISLLNCFIRKPMFFRASDILTSAFSSRMVTDCKLLRVLSLLNNRFKEKADPHWIKAKFSVFLLKINDSEGYLLTTKIIGNHKFNCIYKYLTIFLLSSNFFLVSYFLLPSLPKKSLGNICLVSSLLRHTWPDCSFLFLVSDFYIWQVWKQKDCYYTWGD